MPFSIFRQDDACQGCRSLLRCVRGAERTAEEGGVRREISADIFVRLSLE
jgi:hypothetical protein